MYQRSYANNKTIRTCSCISVLVLWGATWSQPVHQQPQPPLIHRLLYSSSLLAGGGLSSIIATGNCGQQGQTAPECEPSEQAGATVWPPRPACLLTGTCFLATSFYFPVIRPGQQCSQIRRAAASHTHHPILPTHCLMAGQHKNSFRLWLGLTLQPKNLTNPPVRFWSLSQILQTYVWTWPSETNSTKFNSTSHKIARPSADFQTRIPPILTLRYH